MKATTTARHLPKEESLLKHRTLVLGKPVTHVRPLSSDVKMRSHVLDASERVFPVYLPSRREHLIMPEFPSYHPNAITGNMQMMI